MFVSDIHSRIPSVCGEKLNFSAQSLVPTAELNAASCVMLAEPTGHANLKHIDPQQPLRYSASCSSQNLDTFTPLSQASCAINPEVSHTLPKKHCSGLDSRESTIQTVPDTVTSLHSLLEVPQEDSLHSNVGITEQKIHHQGKSNLAGPHNKVKESEGKTHDHLMMKV